MALVAALLLVIAYSGIALAQDVIVQTYYVPVDEDDALDSLRTINTSSIEQVRSYLSIAIGATGTKVYYDHWEDGFLPDFQTNGIKGTPNGTTEIWGDGDCSNGAPPNKNGVTMGTCDSAWDTLNGGDVIVPLSNIGTANAVPTPSTHDQVIDANERAVIDFDGGDMIASTEQIAFARVYWSAGSDTLSAAAFEVHSTSEWGTAYSVPVGTDTTGAGEQFEYTAVSIQAMSAGTIVEVDADANGSYETTFTLTQGESRVVPAIKQGAKIRTNADHPVQVQMLTGDIGSNYSYSGYTLLPTSAFSNDYWAPVGRVDSSYQVRMFFFNPGTNAIPVRCEFNGGTGTNVSVPAGGSAYVDVTSNSTGQHCFTRNGSGQNANDYDPDGGNFFAILTHDLGLTYDWGITMVPATKLDKQVLIGIGLGRDPTSSTNPNENGSPIWVTPTGDACLYVDANGDGWMDNITNTSGPGGYAVPRYLVTNGTPGTHSAGLSASELSSSRFFHADGNQTGMQIFSRERNGDGTCPAFASAQPGPDIVAAWGEDPGKASGGAPGFDVGVTNPNMRAFAAAKFHVLADGGTTAQPGDTITYTVRLRNTSFGTISNVIMKDTLPSQVNNAASVVVLTRYNSAGVAGSTYTLDASEKALFFGTGFQFPVNTTLPTGPLEKGGYIDAVFAVTVNGTPGGLACDSFFVNNVRVTADGKPLDASTSTPCGYPLTIIKKIVGPAGEEFEFDPNANLNGNVNFFLEPATDNGSAEKVFPNLDPNKTYAAQEISIPANWDLSSVVCQSSIPGGFSPTYTQVGGKTTGFGLDLRPNGELISCTFTNTIKTGTITVNKAVVGVPPDVAPGAFEICLSHPSYPIPAPACKTVTLAAGETSKTASWTGLWPSDQYVVTESTGSLPPGLWQVSGNNASATVTPGGTATPTITNTYNQGNLTVSKTAASSRTDTYSWSLQKSATDDVAVFDGQTFNLGWTVTANRTTTPGVTTQVTGQITVNNSSAIAASRVTALTDALVPANGTATIGTCTVDGNTVTIPVTLQPGKSLVCNYSTTGFSGAPGTDFTNRATATRMGGTQFQGDKVFQVAQLYTGPATLEVLDDSSQFPDRTHTFTHPATAWTYSQNNQVCSDLGITYDANGVGSKTITNIVKGTNAGNTSLTANADIEIDCYRLLIDKTVQPSHQITHTWEITKSVDQEQIQLNHGEDAEVNYTIEVSRTTRLGNYKVDGTITVTNPHPGANALPALTDTLNGTPISVSCPASSASPIAPGGTVTVPSGSTLTCTYTAAGSAAQSPSNTAKVVMFGVTRDVTRANPWGTPTLAPGSDPAEVNVTDDPQWDLLGPIVKGVTTGGERTFEYSDTVNCMDGVETSTGSGIFEYFNIAEIVETDQTDDAKVTVTCNPILAKIVLDANAFNEVGDTHTHTATVSVSADGTTWVPAVGATVNFTVTNPAVNQTCAATNSLGQCGVTFVNNSAGVSNIHAKATGTYLGQPFVAETGVGANSSSDKSKTWVDLAIKIGPEVDVNPLNAPHVFTVTVSANDGGGWDPVLGAHPNVTIPGATITANTCAVGQSGTNADGECYVTINSSAPAVFEAQASVTHTVLGVTMTRDTVAGGAHGSGPSPHGANGPAVKKYVDARISISQNATNAVGVDHLFTVKVEKNEGAGWINAGGVVVVPNVAPGSDYVSSTCGGGGTLADGTCTITVKATAAGVTTVSPSASVNVLGVSVPVAYNATAVNAPNGVKTWVDLRIKVSPLTDNNALNDTHTFTALVEEKIGTADWAPVETGTVVTWTVTPTPSTPGAATCTTVGTTGQCSITINSNAPGTFTANAKVTHAHVAGQSLTRDTAGESGPGGSGAAVKKYVTARISILQNATNAVNDPHTFTVKVEKHDGSDWSAANGVTVTPALVAGSVGTITGGTCQSGTTAGAGECTVIVNSLVPGQSTVSASATVAVGTNPTVNVPVTTNSTGGSSAPAVKTWVDARIKIEGTATNPLNDPHTFTITAEQNLGSPNTWVPVPDGTKPVVTITPTGYTLHGTGDTCATTGTVSGVCTVTINSATAAVYTANAALSNFSVSGQAVVRNAPTPAVKTYVSSELLVSKTVVPSWTLEYRWDVTKTVDGPKHLFDGEEDVFNWAIVATKSVSSSYDYKVSGVITVKNNGSLPVTLNKITDTVTGGATPIVVTVNANLCSSATVAANGGTVTCPYGPIDVTGEANLNTAEVEVTTGEKSSGTRGIVWGDPTKKVNDTVDLVDTNGMTTTTSSSIVTPWTYTTELNCSAPEGFTMTGFDQTGTSTGFLDNTVTVHPTGTTTTVLDSSETTGYLSCYQPSVTKTATTSLDRTHTWKISKVASTDAITLTQPATATITYTVKVEKDGHVDSNWKVAGAITLKNPHTTDAATVKVSDMLSNGVTGVIIPDATTCPVVNGEITIPANGTRVCQYGANLTSASALTNIATITQTFGAVDKVYQGTAGVSFTNAAVNNINEDNVDVRDVMTSTLDSSLYDLTRDFPDMGDGATVTYPIEACKDGVYSTNGQIVTYEIENTATIVQDTTKSATEEVEITCIPFGQVQVKKTVAPTYDQHYDWAVTKSADDPLNQFDGETGVFTWTVEAIRTAGLKDNHKIAGTVTISNAGPGNVVVTGISDTTDTGVTIPLSCGLGANPYPYLLVANGVINCTYPATAVPSNTQQNNVTVATSNGPVYGNAPVSFVGATVTPINATAVLSDTLLGIEETLTGSTGPVSYPQTVVNVCADNSGVTWTPGDDWTDYKREGDIVNTAVLYPSSGPQNDTTKFDDAEATQEINCFRLQTNKSADTSLVHTWDWFITKDVSQNTVDLTYPTTQEITYTVSVTRSALPTPSDWKVFGNITIVNPAPMATLVDIEDVLSDNGVAFGNGDPLACTINAAPVTPNGSGLYQVPAGATLVCSYNEDVPAANWQSTALTNTALITQTIDGGEMRYDASDGFSFNIPPATVTKVNETSVDVKDIMTNSLGVTVPEQQWTFTDGHEEEYTHDACKDVDFGTGSTVTYKLNNTATIIQNNKSDSEEVTITCTRPDIVVVGKQFNGAYTEAYTWEITKTVEPESVDMFDGETRVLTWTITTDRSEPFFTGTQSWVIEIFNGSDRTVTVSEVDDSLGVPNCQTPFDVAAGATRTCTLVGAPFTDATALPTDWLDNRVTITTTNGYTATAQVTGSWTGKGTVVNGSANITDTNKSEVWNGNEVITVPIEYTEEVTCESAGVVWSGDWAGGKRQGVRDNTAEVWTPGTPKVTHDSDDASAAINCYRLGISKTVNPYFTRTYQWDIVKKADPVTVQLLDGQRAQVTWTVALTRDQGTESGFGADGLITVYNPAPMEANGVVIADLLPGVTLNCSALNVPAASGQGMGSIACPYSATLASGATVMNTATATYHNKVVTATAEVNFAGAPVTIVNPTVNVTDTNVPTTATVPWYFEGTRTETYTEVLDCADVTYVNGVAKYSIPNTAQIVETKQNSKANVDVTCTALASVGDRVWRDLKPDGTTAADQWAGDGYQNWNIEPNVPGIEVQLWKPGANGTVDGTMLMTTTTDANGKYLFDHLAPGQYYVVFVNRIGYPAVFSTMVKMGTDRTIDSDGTAGIGTGINAGFPVATTEIFTLAAGQHDPTWDQALVSTRGIGSSELGDRFWWDDNKNGIQDAGEEGVDKAKVELFKVDSLNAPTGSGTKVGEQMTDANGNYLFTGLDGGFYYVKFTLPSGVVVTDRFVGSNRAIDSNIDENGYSDIVNLLEGESNLTIDAGIFIAPTADPDDPNGEPNVGDFTNMMWLPMVTNR